MLGIIAILLFAITLLFCLSFKISIIFALIIGFFIFISYGLITGHSLNNLVKMAFHGVMKVKNILLVFVLIGMITALWRASGTIAFIIFYGSKLIYPSIFIFLTFLLCSFLSLLIGTALGTAATMGVICISIARAMGINELYVAGAVLSGIYVGDRNSPLSTSAMLVSEVTKTDLFENLKLMIKSSIFPIIISSIIYLILGLKNSSSASISNIASLFQENYNLSIITAIPAILIILLSIFKINVRISMSISIIIAFIISIFFQNESLINLFKYTIYGYSSQNPELNLMMKGGGILSMLNVSLIVSISSSYSGIFAKTDILKKLKEYIKFVSEKITDFGAILLTAVISSVIACNQSLAIILTEQICNQIMPKKKLAISIENTVVVLAGLVPWSIAMAVPLRALEVVNSAGFFAFFLYILPLWHFFSALKKEKK